MFTANVFNKMVNKTFILFKKELRFFFFSQIAYIFSAIFLAVSGVYFFSRFFIVAQNSMQDYFSILPLMFSFLVPPVTMGLFSSEFQTGSYEIISTQAVSAVEIILAKFFAASVFMVFALFPTIFYAITLYFLGRIDIGPIIGGYVGSLFLILAMCSIGVFASSLTKNQIVALIVSLAIMITLNLFLKFLGIIFPSAINIINFLSSDYHFNSAARGVIDIRDLIYFISVSVIFLYMSYLVIENRK